jgi:hypothetical protein
MDYGKYWKDKLMGGALAAQEGVVDPMLDRVMGTAPGIPPRPWGGTSPNQGRPPSVGFAGESGGPPAKATGKGPPPRLFFGGGMGPSMGQLSPPNRSLVGQGPIPKGTPGVGDKPIAWEWTEDAGLGQQRLTPQKVQPPEPVAPPTRSVAADPSQYQVARPSGFGPEKAAALSRGERGRTPVGPFKKEIAEASAVEGEAITEDDKLKRMLKMMFLSDLVKGTEAPNPDYYSAVSVGPASRAFAPLPSMFRGR